MFLSENPRYKDVLGTGQDIDLFAQRMGASGYATDPEYGTKVANIAQNIRELNKDLGIKGQPRTVRQEFDQTDDQSKLLSEVIMALFVVSFACYALEVIIPKKELIFLNGSLTP